MPALPGGLPLTFSKEFIMATALSALMKQATPANENLRISTSAGHSMMTWNSPADGERHI